MRLRERSRDVVTLFIQDLEIAHEPSGSALEVSMGIVIREGMDDEMFGDRFRVEGGQGLRSPRPTPWEVVGVGSDDHTLRVQFVEGVVEHLHHVDVRDDDATVTLTAFVGLDPAFTGGAVAAVGLVRWTEVTLEEPLADREVLDGAA